MMLITEAIVYVITFLIGSMGSTLAVINAVKHRSTGKKIDGGNACNAMIIY